MSYDFTYIWNVKAKTKLIDTENGSWAGGGELLNVGGQEVQTKL